MSGTSLCAVTCFSSHGAAAIHNTITANGASAAASNHPALAISPSFRISVGPPPS
jgi:hypothetical protein